MKKFTTHVSGAKDGEFVVRGKKLSEIVASGKGFSSAAFFTIAGREPSDAEAKLWDAMLTSVIDHGVAAPSAFVPRTVASTGNSVNAALAAGMLAIGDYHGGAIEAAAELLASDESAEEIVNRMAAAKKVIPGLGHKIYKNEDPRAVALFAKAEELRLYGKYAEKMKALQSALKEKSGLHLAINIDGVIAPLMLELGLSPKIGKAIFAFGRMPGMIAHIEEELTNEKPYRRLDEEDTEYVG
jgi:citryl-CoA lyase